MLTAGSDMIESRLLSKRWDSRVILVEFRGSKGSVDASELVDDWADGKVRDSFFMFLSDRGFVETLKGR